MYLDYKASCRYSLKLKPICFQQDHKSRWAAISNPKSNPKPSDNHRFCPVSKPENRTELDPFGYMYCALFMTVFFVLTSNDICVTIS